MASADELESRKVAEESREKKWQGDSFMKELFLGRCRVDLLDPFPLYPPPEGEREEFLQFYQGLEKFLREQVDPRAIDREGEYPEHVVQGLAELGAFGMKIGKEHGGLGLSHPEYIRVLKMVGAYDANITALLSAHQAIGVPQPVKLFGNEELKQEYLPRCAKGAVSAFALTEPAIGSDPARLSTVCEPTEDGEHFIINGEKLWCTNGTLADLMVVMARDPNTQKINCFVVEAQWEGVKVEHRCRFMGLRALANGVVSFRNVKVPRRNLIGKEGSGLKIALVTLNTGRLSLPAGTAGGTASILELCRKWCNARVQWGLPIGKHEAIAHKLADLGMNAYVMESLAEVVGDFADRKDKDIRLEAAAAKEWNTVTAWHNFDEALQIRGGRGFETEDSLEARGEAPAGVERAMRDSRINLIFEGSSEIMHLFMAREAVDKHLQVAGALADPQASLGTKLAALPKIAMFYLWWYPSRWLGWGWWPRYARFGTLGKHLRYANRASRKLARQIFHGMMRFGPKLEKRQAFLFRAVDIAMELFVLTSAVTKARRLAEQGRPEAEHAARMADMFGRTAKQRIGQWFREMSISRTLVADYDAMKTQLGKSILEGDQTWLEQGVIGLPYEVEDLTPPSVQELLAKRKAQEQQQASGAGTSRESAAE